MHYPFGISPIYRDSWFKALLLMMFYLPTAATVDLRYSYTHHYSY